MRPIRLSQGAGNGINTGCLMNATRMVLGLSGAKDTNQCVCQLLRVFIIPTNDSMPDQLRNELYSPLICMLLGTRSYSRKVHIARCHAFIDWAVREVLPKMLWVNPETYSFAATAAAQPSVSESFKTVYHYVIRLRVQLEGLKVGECHPLRKALQDLLAAFNLMDSGAHSHWMTALNTVAHVGNVTTQAGAMCDADVWRMCPVIIKRVIAIGDRRPFSTVITQEQLGRALGYDDRPASTHSLEACSV